MKSHVYSNHVYSNHVFTSPELLVVLFVIICYYKFVLDPPFVYIPQRGVQWKQGAVIYMTLYTSSLYNTTPTHCTPDPLHPPLQSIHFGFVLHYMVFVMYIYIYIYIYGFLSLLYCCCYLYIYGVLLLFVIIVHTFWDPPPGDGWAWRRVRRIAIAIRSIE